MDPANTVLGRMLLEEVTPVVMVLPTSTVEETCLKNGLSFVQLLSPFCNFNNIDVPVRTASDQPYRLQKFKLRLFYASDIRQQNLEAAKERLKLVITKAGEKDLSDSELCSDPPQIADVLKCSESEILPSWFQSFNKELVRTLSFSDHEAFDHPVACLLVVSSKDAQPINRFIDLFNSDKLPSIISDGAMDPKILKHYLLVHDNQDGTPEKAAKILSEMRSTFGPSDCQLLCINSSEDGVVDHQDYPWATYKFDALLDQRLGFFLTKDDVDEVKVFMQDLSTKYIIPHMEQKIRVLNQQVSVTRKGFRNQIKNLWWRKGKEDTPDAPSGTMYTFSSTESQIRVLGDYAFMLRDYELALSNYRLISTDYKLDKAWKHYAGVQEMMGLTYFMLDQSRKEAEYCMENAFNTYLKMGPSGQQNATRCGLWWVEMLKTRDQYKEAATVYFRICNEDPVLSAVMLEQASYCYLYCKPPMLSKYGFHLVLSGDRYKRCDQTKQAIRTYRSALSIFKGTTWSYIKDHVHFHIGQWYALLGMYDVAVAHMLEVLACSHQSKTTQELFLRNFLQTVQKTGKTFEVLKLQLPVIDISSPKVFFEDHRTYASPAAASVKESSWRSLEEDMIPSLPTGRTNWLELQSKLISKNFKESNVCVAGEAIKVDIEFKNPLQIPISITNVSLMCALSSNSDETESDADSSTTKIQNDKDFRESSTHGDMNSDTSAYSLSEVDFQLGGGETMVVQLMVTPRAEGTLKIIGVRWKLSGSVVGFHNFESNLLKKSNAKGRRKAKKAPTDNLKFIVIKSLPKLQSVIQYIPQKVYAGDLRHLILELKNQSEFGIKNLKMKISHPRFLNIGTPEDLNTEFPTCLEKKTNYESCGLNSSKGSQAVFLFPEDTVIQGETPLLWPLWFRAAVPGNVSLYITIYYEMGDISSVIKYRTLRMHYNVQVLPSLDVSFRINPSPSRLQEFLVRMDVINRTISECFEVHQLSSLGAQWEISLFQSVASEVPSQYLMAGQALSYFFLLKKCRKALTSEYKSSSLFPSVGSNVRFNIQGSNEQLYNISCSPLAEFHNCERLDQEASHQDFSNTVDFILISRLKSNISSGVSNETHLFSHHACCCSIKSTSPISWLVEGPRTVHHNFAASFCEINLKMTIYNLSDAVVRVCINTNDSQNSGNQLPDASAGNSGNQVGWHDLSIANEIKVTSDVQGTRVGNSLPAESISPFIWSGSSSTKLQLEPMSASEIPLQICVFSPGTYNLSNYVLDWNLLNREETDQSSGTCQGYPLYLTALHST